MVTKIKVIIASALAGWIIIGLWSIVSYQYSGGKCGFLSRLNIAEAPGAIFFCLAALLLFAISAIYGYKLLMDRQEMDSLKNKKWPFFIGALFLFFAVLAPSLNTHDINFYFSAGKATASGINVFVDNWEMTNAYFCPPQTQQLNGIMYGPIVVALFGLVYALAGGSAFLFIFFWKFIMLICFLLLSFLIWKIINVLMDKPVEKKGLFLFLCSQPALVWYWLANGQFDSLWVVFVLLAILFSIKKYWFLVFSSLLIGVWIKFVPLLIAPWFVLWWWQETNKSNWKNNTGQALGSVLAGSFFTYIIWKPFWEGATVFNSIMLQSKWAVNSLFSVLYFSLRPLFMRLFNANAHWLLTRALHGALVMLVLYLIYPLGKKVFFIMLKKITWAPADYIFAIFVSMLIYLCVWQKSFWPWYLSWLLPFGIILFLKFTVAPLKKILIWLSATSFIFYIIWIINHVVRGTDAPSELWFQYAIVLLIWVYPFIQLCKWRRTGYNIDITN